MILVTGATGKIGSRLVKQLSEAGVQVRALVRNPDKAATLKAPNVEIVTGDLNQPVTLDAALREVERLFLLPPNTRNQAEMENNLFQAAKLASIGHVVKLSTVKADINSPSHFFREHWLAEKHLRRSGIPFTILQSNSFMQNLLWFAIEIKSEGRFSLPMKDAQTAPVDIRDIVSVAAAVLTEKNHEGRTYNITGPEALSFKEVAEKLSVATGKRITYNSVSLEDFKKILVRGGPQGWFADALVAAWKVASEGHPTVTNVVSEVAQKEPITFEQFAQDYAHVFESESPNLDIT